MSSRVKLREFSVCDLLAVQMPGVLPESETGLRSYPLTRDWSCVSSSLFVCGRVPALMPFKTVKYLNLCPTAPFHR